MQKLAIDNLVVEITQRCNLKCDHCMRGGARPKDISAQRINAMLNGIAEIRELTITGGEPSLKPDIMQSLLTLVKKKKIPVDLVYLVTNGKRVTEDFLKACRDWHMYTVSGILTDKTVSHDRAASIIKWADEERSYGCHVALSLDRFHGDIKTENLYKLMTLPNLNLDKYNKGWNDTDWVINTGRARENGWGARSFSSERPWMFGKEAKIIDFEETGSSEDDSPLRVEQLYVTAEGYVCKYCDYSFTQEKKMAMMRIPEKDTKPGAWVDELRKFSSDEN